jgi:methylmalonyl-CoA mutase
MKKVKASRDEAKAQETLAKLQESARKNEITSAGENENNLLRLCVECAAARCTLGEMSQAMESQWGRYAPTGGLVQGAYGASFKSGSSEETLDEYHTVLREVEEFEASEGRRPRILVAKMGQDGHDRGAKVISSGFADVGWDVDVGPLFQTPREVALQAIDADVHVIGVSSQAAGHKTLLPALKAELKALGAEHIVVVCGGVVPPADYDFLLKETQSCSAVFGPGTRIIDAAKRTLKMIPRQEEDDSLKQA